jgi:large subunit ribosomal protein L5
MASEEKKKSDQQPRADKAPKGESRPAKGEGKPKGKKAESAETEPVGPRVPPRLKVLYDTQVRSRLSEQFGLKNPMAQPVLEKVVLNVNMGRHLEGSKIPPHIRQTVIDTLTKISGQRPVVIKARKSVSNFKLRAGFENSAMVTLRRDRMWHFLDRFIHLASPRIKDFRGLSPTAFDRQGNYSLGLNEQGVFPEINMAEAAFTHGMNINICFRRSDPVKSRAALEALGFPFRRDESEARAKA